MNRALSNSNRSKESDPVHDYLEAPYPLSEEDAIQQAIEIERERYENMRTKLKGKVKKQGG
jgi:hypothetical protein